MKITEDGRDSARLYSFKPLVTVTEAAFLLGTWYDGPSATDSLVAYLSFDATGSVAAAFTVEVTIDGTAYTGVLNPLPATVFYVSFPSNSDTLLAAGTEVLIGTGVPVYARSISVRWNVAGSGGSTRDMVSSMRVLGAN